MPSFTRRLNHVRSSYLIWAYSDARRVGTDAHGSEDIASIFRPSSNESASLTKQGEAPFVKRVFPYFMEMRCILFSAYL